MADLHPIVWRELGKLDELDVLDDGEVICELEFAVLDGEPGALAVTDQRVLFSSTTALGRRTQLQAVQLSGIECVETSNERRLWRERGVLRIVLGDHQGPGAFSFRRISGGEARAEELARTVLRQKRYLEEGSAEKP